MSDRPYGTTVFCDDIRQEVSGKVTLVGCYSDELVISGADFPIALRQLGFVINYFEPNSLPWKPIRVRIFFPGEKEPVLEFGIEDAPPEVVPRDGHKPNLRAFRAYPLLSPVMLRERGRIKVRAFRGDEKVRLGSLLVRKEDRQEDKAAP